MAPTTNFADSTKLAAAVSAPGGEIPDVLGTCYPPEVLRRPAPHGAPKTHHGRLR